MAQAATKEVEAPAETESAATEEAPNHETEARSQGWRPKEEYDALPGTDPKKWVDAETFIKRGEESLPIIRSLNRKLNGELKEMRELVKDVLANQKADRERVINETITKLQGEKRTAIEEANPQKVAAIDTQIDTLKADKPKDEARQTTTQLPPEFYAWEKSNKWFRDDPALRRFAIGQFDILLEDPETAELSDDEKLKLVSAETRKRYPEKFTNPARKNPSLVESGGNGTPRMNGKHSFSDLPPEAQTICDRLVKQKVVKDRAAYLAEYPW